MQDGQKKYHCILISLYGLSTIQDISRCLFFEAHTVKYKNSSFLKKAEEITPSVIKRAGKNIYVVGKGFGKTIIKGIASQKGIELGISQKDLSELFKLVDMRDKLLILEDLERSQVNILELMGYVNSLVEQDHVKVLLIANEKKFIQRIKEDTTDNNGKKEDVFSYTDSTKKYLKTKEKTISDTINYEADIKETIKDILRLFGNSLSSFDNQSSIEDIASIFDLLSIYNFRSFIFACQKTVDIYEHISTNANEEFLKCIFFSIIAFSLKYKNDAGIKWEERGECSYELGIGNYPLFRFCYDYIFTHRLEEEIIQKSIEILNDIRLYDTRKSRNDPDLHIINTYYIQEETKVREAIDSIRIKLKTDSVISFVEYGRLMLSLIRLSKIIDIEIEDIKTLMIENLRGKGDQLRPEGISDVIEKDENESVMKEYKEVKEKMIDSLLYKENPMLYGFDYTENTMDSFSKEVRDNTLDIWDEGGLIHDIDIPRLIESMKLFSAAGLQELRGVFLSVYRNRHVLKEEMPYMMRFKSELENLLKYPQYDAIQQYQINLFIKNLKKYMALEE